MLQYTLKLSHKRMIFTAMMCELKQFMISKDVFPVTNHVFRCPDCQVGKANSKHKEGLAEDINLFDKNGIWLTATNDHLIYGILWEQWGGIWGGRFKDGNHYEYADELLNGLRIRQPIYYQRLIGLLV